MDADKKHRAASRDHDGRAAVGASLSAARWPRRRRTLSASICGKTPLLPKEATPARAYRERGVERQCRLTAEHAEDAEQKSLLSWEWFALWGLMT